MQPRDLGGDELELRPLAPALEEHDGVARGASAPARGAGAARRDLAPTGRRRRRAAARSSNSVGARRRLGAALRPGAPRRRRAALLEQAALEVVQRLARASGA